jgi:hypothetical protein
VFTCAQTWNGNTVDGRRCDHFSPALLTVVDRIGEEIIEEKTFERFVLVERGFDIA